MDGDWQQSIDFEKAEDLYREHFARFAKVVSDSGHEAFALPEINAFHSGRAQTSKDTERVSVSRQQLNNLSAQLQAFSKLDKAHCWLQIAMSFVRFTNHGN